MPETRVLLGHGGHVSFGGGTPIAITSAAVHIERDEPAFQPFGLDRAQVRWAVQVEQPGWAADVPKDGRIVFHRTADGVLYAMRAGSNIMRAPVEPAPLKRVRSVSAGHPSRITVALDYCAAYGPEVDEALGVAEPTVDLWESGDLTPTETDLLRLSTLTGFPPQWFANRKPVPEINGPVFVCKR